MRRKIHIDIYNMGLMVPVNKTVSKRRLQKRLYFTAGDECRRLMILQVSEQIQENVGINIPVCVSGGF